MGARREGAERKITVMACFWLHQIRPTSRWPTDPRWPPNKHWPEKQVLSAPVEAIFRASLPSLRLKKLARMVPVRTSNQLSLFRRLGHVVLLGRTAN